MKTLISTQDNSINFVENTVPNSIIESRFVERPTHYIGYLSSQTGCNKGCKFCHLTATKQTVTQNVLLAGFKSQAKNILRLLSEGYPNKKHNLLHFNFMARGEPLSNSEIVNNADSLFYNLSYIVKRDFEDMFIRYNISTIIPKNIEKSLVEMFKVIHPTIYFSYYSANPDFRSKWMPMAMNLNDSLLLLKEYQKLSKKTLKFHHCFIKGENDSVDDVREMLNQIAKHDLDVEFNLVRYNPFSEKEGEESSLEVISRNMSLISTQLISKIVPRVGYDVKASCGMFVGKDGV